MTTVKREAWDKLSPDWEKEGKSHTESEFFIDFVVCIEFECARMEREKSQAESTAEDYRKLETVRIG